jgi:5'-AMP-activated protein kinase catalytic alpha subunit
MANEILTLKTLYHPKIIRLFQVMETMEHDYLVMEHVNGQQLWQRIIDDQRLCEDAVPGHFHALSTCRDILPRKRHGPQRPKSGQHPARCPTQSEGH